MRFDVSNRVHSIDSWHPIRLPFFFLFPSAFFLILNHFFFWHHNTTIPNTNQRKKKKKRMRCSNSNIDVVFITSKHIVWFINGILSARIVSDRCLTHSLSLLVWYCEQLLSGSRVLKHSTPNIVTILAS